jgi:hypothetical protein
MTRQHPAEVAIWAERLQAHIAATLARLDAEDEAARTFQGRARIAKLRMQEDAHAGR